MSQDKPLDVLPTQILVSKLRKEFIQQQQQQTEQPLPVINPDMVPEATQGEWKE